MYFFNNIYNSSLRTPSRFITDEFIQAEIWVYVSYLYCYNSWSLWLPVKATAREIILDNIYSLGWVRSIFSIRSIVVWGIWYFIYYLFCNSKSWVKARGVRVSSAYSQKGDCNIRQKARQALLNTFYFSNSICKMIFELVQLYLSPSETG